MKELAGFDFKWLMRSTSVRKTRPAPRQRWPTFEFSHHTYWQTKHIRLMLESKYVDNFQSAHGNAASQQAQLQLLRVPRDSQIRQV